MKKRLLCLLLSVVLLSSCTQEDKNPNTDPVLENPVSTEAQPLAIVQDGKSSQIDHILLNSHGIFVIETKNYKGVVYGSEGKNYWRQYLKNKSEIFLHY